MRSKLGVHHWKERGGENASWNNLLQSQEESTIELANSTKMDHKRNDGRDDDDGEERFSVGMIANVRDFQVTSGECAKCCSVSFQNDVGKAVNGSTGCSWKRSCLHQYFVYKSTQ
ncbi:hypothetical protein TrispH2_001783 [Trichoplax sp. H2]|nr:hypothetical protein TrispH2_001783 [Trichoplax sp. H2]|eukprot:RDD45995.1 hypothetical protein TrispH2_001783 [Trichoplax sp. H2]